MLGIAAATDYGIFLFGRYREARQAGEDRETAYYTTFRSVTPVVLGSGLTIAGATYCLSFARLPYFRTMGVPSPSECSSSWRPRSRWGRLFFSSAAVSDGSKPSARLRVGCGGGWAPRSCGGRADPGRQCRGGADRHGRPAGYTTNYNDRFYLPGRAPANLGIRGRRPAFLAGPDESGHPDDRR